MPNSLQNFLTLSTQKAADELVAAFLRLPLEKRNWSPEVTSRSALDQVIECAILNGFTATLIQTRVWSPTFFEDYGREKAKMVTWDWETLQAKLQEATHQVLATLSTVPEEDLFLEVPMPWGKQTVADILSYPYWNMTYHLGQINYLASLLGCLPMEGS